MIKTEKIKVDDDEKTPFEIDPVFKPFLKDSNKKLKDRLAEQSYIHSCLKRSEWSSDRIMPSQTDLVLELKRQSALGRVYENMENCMKDSYSTNTKTKKCVDVHILTYADHFSWYREADIHNPNESSCGSKNCDFANKFGFRLRNFESKDCCKVCYEKLMVDMAKHQMLTDSDTPFQYNFYCYYVDKPEEYPAKCMLTSGFSTEYKGVCGFFPNCALDCLEECEWHVGDIKGQRLRGVKHYFVTKNPLKK